MPVSYTPKWGAIHLMEPHSNVTAMSTKADENKWLDPRFLAQMLVIIVGIGTTSWVGSRTAERRATTLEVSAANLDAKATKMEASQAQIQASVNTITANVVRLQSDRESDRRDIDSLKDSMEARKEWETVINGKIERLLGQLNKK